LTDRLVERASQWLPKRNPPVAVTVTLLTQPQVEARQMSVPPKLTDALVAFPVHHPWVQPEP
jgi:hypothetical protein